MRIVVARREATKQSIGTILAGMPSYFAQPTKDSLSDFVGLAMTTKEILC
jgi:hypothetical protein